MESILQVLNKMIAIDKRYNSHIIETMENVAVYTLPEVDMALIRNAKALNLLKSSNGIETSLVLTSFQLRKDQKELIEKLAEQNSERQATIIRAIIDEWREMKLSGCE